MARDDEGYGRLSSMDIAEELGFGQPEFDDFVPQRGDARLEGILDAVKDLEPAGIEMQGRSVFAKRFGRTRSRRSSTNAPRVFSLRSSSEARRKGTVNARLVEVRFGELWQEITGPVDDEHRSSMNSMSVLGDLAEKGLLRVRPAGGTNPEVYPTYLGVVRATQRDELEWLDLVAALVDEWETTSVEFKRRLDLSTREARGEFVHDVIALATTKASGRRFLVIGFDEATHRFAESVDASVYHDRIEQILNRYAEPIPGHPSSDARLGERHDRRTRSPSRSREGSVPVQEGRRRYHG